MCSFVVADFPIAHFWKNIETQVSGLEAGGDTPEVPPCYEGYPMFSDDDESCLHKLQLYCRCPFLESSNGLGKNLFLIPIPI